MKNNYESWYKENDNMVAMPYLVEATPADWIDLDKAKQYNSLEAYDKAGGAFDELECDMQDWFASVGDAKRYIQQKFESGEFIKACIYDDSTRGGDVIFGYVYNEDWFDIKK